jgi:FixJ family two-component response regulator
MIPTDSIVFIVDDDEAVRDSLALLLSLNGFATRVFDSAENFLAACQPEWAGCLVLDIRMQGMDGLELQRTLNARNVRLPIIVITAHGDVAMAREALKAGAVDFLEKPIDDQLLIANVSTALDYNARMMEKLQVRNIPELIRVVIAAAPDNEI